MAIQSSFLAWKIPWTEEPGRLQSMGLQRVRHNWTCMHTLSYIPTYNISDISIYSYSCMCLSVEKITNTCCYSITKSCQLFATPWIAACQASLSFNISLSLLKLMSSESVMTSTISSSVIPFSSCTQSCPASGSFPMSRPFASGGQSVGASASASVLPMNIQGWLPLGLTDLFAVQGPRNKLLAHMVYICSLWIVITNSFSNSNNLHNQYYQQHSKIYNMDNLGDIMLSEISQIQNDKNCIILHLCGIKKKKSLIKVESRMVLARDQQCGESGTMSVKGYKGL